MYLTGDGWKVDLTQLQKILDRAARKRKLHSINLGELTGAVSVFAESPVTKLASTLGSQVVGRTVVMFCASRGMHYLWQIAEAGPQFKGARISPFYARFRRQIEQLFLDLFGMDWVTVHENKFLIGQAKQLSKI